MLAVVQDEQDPAAGERRDQPVGCIGLRAAGRGEQPRLPQAECAEYRLRYLRAVAERREIDETGIVGLPACGLDRRAGLAGATRAGQGDQAPLGEEPADPRELLLAPDETGELNGHPEPHGRHRMGSGAEQSQMDRGQFRRGVGAQLLGEGPPGVLERRKGLGLPAAGLQRPHEQPD